MLSFTKSRLAGKKLVLVSVLVLQFYNPLPIIAQTDSLYDVFPLAKWNQYYYNYLYSDTTYYVGSFEYAQNDSGTIAYSLLDSSLVGNKVEWLVEQKINLLRHYITPEIDTLFWIENKYNFILTEYLNGNHELIADPPTWDSTGEWGTIGIWKFYEGSIFRYRDTPSFNIFYIGDSLWFDNRGLYKRIYYSSYNGIHQIYTHTKINLDSTIVGIEYHTLIFPENFHLSQNYPNPFNPSTIIGYQLPVAGNVTLKVYDVLGREVETLVDEYRNAGSYEVEFKSTIGSLQLANGVYFYQLQAGSYVEIKKMILLK